MSFLQIPTYLYRTPSNPYWRAGHRQPKTAITNATGVIPGVYEITPEHLCPELRLTAKEDGELLFAVAGLK